MVCGKVRKLKRGVRMDTTSVVRSGKLRAAYVMTDVKRFTICESQISKNYCRSK